MKTREFIQTEENNRLLDTSIFETLTLSTRATKVFKHYGIETVRDLVDIVNSHNNWLTKLQNCGAVTRNEILKEMKSVGFRYTDALLPVPPSPT
jgi:DNA-directed RNA polymerase alpha subunit